MITITVRKRWVVVLLLILAATPACRSIRNSMMDMRNGDMTGKAAPPIEGESWILSEGAEVPAPTAQDRWRVAAFLKPK